MAPQDDRERDGRLWHRSLEISGSYEESDPNGSRNDEEEASPHTSTFIPKEETTSTVEASPPPIASPQTAEYDDDVQVVVLTTTTTATTSTMEQLDLFEPVARPSLYQRQSFLVTFTKQKGPRAILLLIVCLALGLGSTIGVVPAVMTDRYARLRHGYADEADCATYHDVSNKPQACLDGSADAQNGSALETLVSNVLTFVTSSLVGSMSDEHGRRGVFCVCVFVCVCLLTRGYFSPCCLTSCFVVCR